MRVLVADDDPISATVMEALVTSAGHRCLLVHDGNAAWEILSGDDPPQVVFLDWMMPGIDGIELCRRIRQRGSASYTYVAILSVRNKKQDITLGFQSGADDFITKPYQAEEVLARLHVAERLIRSTSAESSLRRAVDEARRSPGGDLIVRSANRVGRVFFHAGHVAWAHVSDEPGSLAAMLREVPTISREDIQAVLEECTATGRSFSEVIVEWELMGPDEIRGIVRDWIRRKVTAIAGFPSPSLVFSPEERAYGSKLLFAPEEVFPLDLLERPANEASSPLATSEVGSVETTPELAKNVAQSLDRAIGIGGAVSAAIFDGRTGICLGARGDAVDVDLVWSHLRLASIGNTWDELEDIIISTKHQIFILRPFTKEPPRSLFVALDRANTKIGMARLALADCVRS